VETGLTPSRKGRKVFLDDRLAFNDQAEEAVNFYVSFFPDSEILDVARFREGTHGAVGSVMSILLWEKLSEGGEQGPCGWLKDRFGVSWQVVPTALFELLQDKDAQKVHNVTQAMLKMSKIETSLLQQAYDQE
jgi:predicted 3-demethylubiquinone-9 3-methyltransferase (glyoxalase superfamily)